VGVLVRPDKHKPGRWWVRVNYRGRRRSLAFSSRKAADVAAVKLDAALKLGNAGVLDPAPVAPAAPVPTLKDYAERWLEQVGSVRLRPSTVEQYRNRLRVRVYPTLGHLPLTSLTREAIRTALGDMVRAGNLRTPDKPVARATVRETVTTLGTILATAVEDGLLPANPCTGLRKHIGNTGGQEAQEVEVFTPDALARLLAVAEQDYPTWHPFLLCLARSGMRLGEAVALRWSDVDLERRVILVRRSERKGRVSEPKSGKARRVDMSGQLAAVLRGHKSLQEAEAAIRGHALPERVFSTPGGRAIADDAFRNNVWRPILRRAGLRYRKPHTLRHTYASLLLDRGLPLTYVQHQLGHSSATITLKAYAHLVPRADRRAVDALDDAPAVPIRKPDATDEPADDVTPREDDPSRQCGQFQTERCIYRSAGRSSASR
jgi:integrase